MKTTIFGIKTCDTCRKAIKALPDATFHDIRLDPLTDEERGLLIALFGEKLINRASTTWRGLSEVEKAQDLDTLLATHPTLMKRPVIQHKKGIFLGWKDDVRTALGV